MGLPQPESPPDMFCSQHYSKQLASKALHFTWLHNRVVYLATQQGDVPGVDVCISQQGGVSGYTTGWRIWLHNMVMYLATQHGDVSGYTTGWCIWLHNMVMYLATQHGDVPGYTTW